MPAIYKSRGGFRLANALSILALCLLLGGLWTSCQSNNKEDMFEAANTVYDHIASGEFEALPPLMAEESLIFYQKMTDRDYLNFDSIFILGQEYGLPYTTLTYLMDYGRHMRRTNDPTDFFLFLVFEKVSYFNIEGFYSIEKTEYQLGRNLRVGMSRDLDGKKSLTWVSLKDVGNDDYKFDILYNLKLAEHRFAQYYKDAREKAKDASAEDWLWAIYDQTGENKLDIDNLEKRIEAKKKEYLEKKGSGL